MSDDEALALAAAVERDSEHTIAQGIVKSAEERRLSIPKAEAFRAIPGHGVRRGRCEQGASARRPGAAAQTQCRPLTRRLRRPSIARPRAGRPRSR